MNLLGDFRYVSPTELQALGYLQEPHPRTFQGAAEAGLAAWRRRMRKVQRPLGVLTAARPAVAGSSFSSHLCTPQLHGALMSIINHALGSTHHDSVGSASPTCYETSVQYNVGNLSGLMLVPFMQCRVVSLALP